MFLQQTSQSNYKSMSGKKNSINEDMTNLVTDYGIIWIHRKQFGSKSSMARIADTLVIYKDMS